MNKIDERETEARIDELLDRNAELEVKLEKALQLKEEAETLAGNLIKLLEHSRVVME